MKENLFNLVLDSLQLQTLAYLAGDLQDRLEDWQYYPEDAPPEPLQQELRQTLQGIVAAGAKRAEIVGLDFAELVAQAAPNRDQDDWRWQRNQQVQQNWTSDLQ
jgi:hypothetical protein